MFRLIYEIVLVVFLLQGALLPVLVLVSGQSTFRQAARLTRLEKELRGDRGQHKRTLASLLKVLPRLQPLNCAACGGVVALETASTICMNCRARGELPEDYRSTISLRERLRRLAARAIRYWYVAWLLTSFPVRAFLFLMIFVEPLMLLVVIIGAASYSDTFADRAAAGMGGGLPLVLGIMAFAGFFIWMIIFILLTNVAKGMRRELPVFPALRDAEAAAIEFATCRSCGGGIHFGSRSFACLCGYCGVENFRADYVRRERAGAEGHTVTTGVSLFRAMEIIEEFTSTLFITMAVLSFAFLLFVIVRLFTGWEG